MAKSSLLRRDAQKLYKGNDHQGALAVLEKILASAPSQEELLGTLDLRVSVHLKVDDKISARKDATQMVRINKADGRGYLRLGQLERLTGDQAAAIGWYKHGLKKVPESDRLYAHIATQHAKTMAALRAQTVISKPVDPFMKLPAEIVEMTLRSFNYREAVICLRVSKTWRHMLHTYSTLRNTLDFSSVSKGKLVTFFCIKAALRRSQRAERPTLVIAKNLTEPAARHLKETMERWIHYTNMQHFEVDYRVGGDGKPPNINFSTLQWHRFQLRTVNFGSKHTVTMDAVYNILQSCELLQKAIFLSVSPGLTTNVEANVWAHSTTASRPNLALLTIQGLERPFNDEGDFLLPMPAKFLDRFAELQHLTITNVWLHLDAAPHIAIDLSVLKSLRSFDCSGCQLTSWPTLPASLEVLDYTKCQVDEQSNPDSTPLGRLHVARLTDCLAASNIMDNIRMSASRTLGHLELGLNTGLHYESGWASFLRLLKSGTLMELTFLGLHYPMLSDDHIDLLVEHCRKLEIVELSSPNITGVFIVSLLSTLGSSIKRIALRNCIKISPDAIEWARDRGVIVERTTTETYGGSGRRVHGRD